MIATKGCFSLIQLTVQLAVLVLSSCELESQTVSIERVEEYSELPSEVNITRDKSERFPERELEQVRDIKVGFVVSAGSVADRW